MNSQLIDKVLVAIGEIIAERRHRNESAQTVTVDLYNKLNYELVWHTTQMIDILEVPLDERHSTKTVVARVYTCYDYWAHPRKMAMMIAGIIEGFEYDQRKGD